MATKRGMCPYCRNNNYFLVNPEAVSCFCGTNIHQISPQDAIAKYDRYIDNLIYKANDTLELVGNANLAYQEYADVIELDEAITYPYFGRILSLIYMSKVRKSRLDDARLLFITGESQHFNKLSEVPLIVASIRKIARLCEDYLSRVYRQLTLKQFYYDSSCLTLYMKHVYEVMEFEKELLEYLTSIKKKFQSEKIDTVLNYLDEMIAEKERKLNDYEHVIISGEHYKVILPHDHQELSVELIPNKTTNTKTARYRLSTLDSGDKKKRYIKDVIFKDYTSIIGQRKRFLFYTITSSILCVGAGISAVFFYDNFILFISLLIGAGVLFLFAILTLIFFIIWSTKISKKKHNRENTLIH